MATTKKAVPRKKEASITEKIGHVITDVTDTLVETYQKIVHPAPKKKLPAKVTVAPVKKTAVAPVKKAMAKPTAKTAVKKTATKKAAPKKAVPKAVAKVAKKK